MNKSRDAFCRAIKNKYPEISAKADREYSRKWGEFDDPEFYSYSWFEALANAINGEMCKSIPASNYTDLLNSISDYFEAGDKSIKECIDVAFVENLFWQVPEANARDYWDLMPQNLRTLYVQFHRREPL